MVPVVYIDGVAEQTPTVHVEAMLEACSSGLADGTCRLTTSHEEESPPAAALAVLSWHQGELLTVTIQVGSEERQTARWRERELRFSEDDPVIERWRSVGFSVATLASAMLLQRDAPDSRQRPRAGAPAATPAEPEAAIELPRDMGTPAGDTALPHVADHPFLDVDAGVLFAAPIGSDAHLGPWLGLRARPWQPPLVLAVDVAQAWAPETEAQFESQWQLLTLSGLVDGFSASFAALRLGLGVAAQRQQVRLPPAPEQASALRLGVHGTMSVRTPGRTPFAAVFGASVTRFDAPIEIRVDGEPASRIGTWNLAVTLGASWRALD